MEGKKEVQATATESLAASQQGNLDNDNRITERVMVNVPYDASGDRALNCFVDVVGVKLPTSKRGQIADVFKGDGLLANLRLEYCFPIMYAMCKAAEAGTL